MSRAAGPRTLLAAVRGALWLGLLLAQGVVAGEPPTLTVFAASDLAFAFRELVPPIERALDARVTLVLGSTGNLARQIEHGAPADVFFAADEQFVDRLVAGGRLIPESRVLYAEGRLVLATARQAGPKLTELGDLRAARIRHVAVAHPGHAPYGRRAEEVLRAAGLWDAVRPKLVYGDDVRHALGFLQSGAAEAGLVALAVAGAPGIAWVPIDPRLHSPLRQVAAVVRRSPRPELGQALIRFVAGPDGRAIMKRYGFLLPGDF